MTALRRTGVAVALAAGLLLAGSPAHAATPTPATPANARTLASCTATAPGRVPLIGTALADTFLTWRGTRLGALGTSAYTRGSRTTFERATLVWRDRAGRNVLTSISYNGYWLKPARDPRPGDRVKVTIQWQTKRLGLRTGRTSCAAYLTLPRSFGGLA